MRADLLYLSCLPDVLMTVSVLWLFLTVPWVDLQCAVMVFPDHTHYFFIADNYHAKIKLF